MICQSVRQSVTTLNCILIDLLRDVPGGVKEETAAAVVDAVPRERAVRADRAGHAARRRRADRTRATAVATPQ